MQLKKMCKEGAYWGMLLPVINTNVALYIISVYVCSSGSIAGVYVGVEYGIDKIRGHRDWVGIRY